MTLFQVLLTLFQTLQVLTHLIPRSVLLYHFTNDKSEVERCMIYGFYFVNDRTGLSCKSTYLKHQPILFHKITGGSLVLLSAVLLFFSFSLILTENLLCASSTSSSVAQSCPTLCDPMNRSRPGLPVHHQLPEFTQTHVHRVGDAIQPSHPLPSRFPFAPNPSQHQSLFQ